jgi:hypothetical protein
MTNTQIAEALNYLLPEGNWGSFTGDANNAQEFETNLNWTGSGVKPTWEQISTAIVPSKPEPSVAEKLASVGLSISDLKTALGLSN